MPSSKAIGAFTSDWHFKPYNWASRPEIKGDAVRSGLFIKNYCIQHALDLYVLGDLFDSRSPDPQTVGWMMDIINDLKDHFCDFCYLQGQHELFRARPWASLNRNATWIHKKHFPIDSNNVMAYGLDYQPPDKLAAALDEIPKNTDILLAHQVWRERMGGFRGKDLPADGAFADVPYVKMIISGDYHSHMVTQHRGKQGQQVTTVSPGSTFLKATDEDPNKYFFLLYDDLRLESVKIPTRPLLRTRAGTDEALFKQTSELLDKYAEVPDDDPDKPIWYAEYRPSVVEAAQRLERAALNRAHLFLRPLRETAEEEINEAAAEVEATDDCGLTELAEFLPRCGIAPDSEVYKTAVRLDRAPNVKDELKQIIHEAITTADNAKGDSW